MELLAAFLLSSTPLHLYVTGLLWNVCGLNYKHACSYIYMYIVYMYV